MSRGAPVGREVTLRMHTSARLLPGDYLRSETTGRTWPITNVHTIQRVRAIVVPEDHPQPDDHVTLFTWLRRV